MAGKLFVVGFGPGSVDHMTKRAREAIEESDVIVGYKTYVDLVMDLIHGKEVICTGMTEEVSRAQEAIKQAERGKKVAVISSGDAGLYGMAGLVYEVLIEKGWKKETGVEVEIIPGISAIHSCAALLGAPIMHDACTISLSDHLTPWHMIAKRIEAAAAADFVIALYNPKSGRRTQQIVEAQRILLTYRSPNTPVGLVKSAYRERQHVVITNLGDMLQHEIGMLTTVIIGNSSTFIHDGLMITPRGYERKYTLSSAVQPLKPHERLRPEAEPWALANVRTLAEEACEKVTSPKKMERLEVAISPGVANKTLTPQQMTNIARIVGERGTIVYTPDHYLKVTMETERPDEVIASFLAAGLTVAPVGDVLVLKACDFCDGEKKDAIPYAEQLYKQFGGMSLPKELRLGFNGCGMACYGAVNEDIGIVYRKGAFDLFLGGKTVGRNAHPGQLVAEGIHPDDIVATIARIIEQYKEEGYANERFHKFFERKKEVGSFVYGQTKKVEPAACGE
ncbi:cobalt-precorrin-3B C(17)-methyltransferase [Anoxybacillus gonensis]|uniref:Precorrin-3B C(17)-methyltransferase n=1 Tax=Anoxybacillus gonensis TaxID=198467 RepID=A0AAW7TFY9_9BACL|nr:precorrin-3B C(17)-methyltransferase [Anoxybacillus gonensis]AKS37573.1 cobalt-precorrin-3B C(17)-methyltransferase [Anoxybacillus gonensis]KGP61500.1 cobalt-precorrin-3B C(17)-methyltransferase [Anoxybacillus gonensis]MDO0876616.1 precorrin-3B C(17)-methyltransferase [Anoxybacillus gonensis]